MSIALSGVDLRFFNETRPICIRSLGYRLRLEKPERSFALNNNSPDQYTLQGQFALRFGANEMLHGHSQGALSDHQHTVQWNVCWSLDHDSLRHFPQHNMYEETSLKQNF